MKLSHLRDEKDQVLGGEYGALEVKVTEEDNVIEGD
jgi:hypothetical protein